MYYQILGYLQFPGADGVWGSSLGIRHTAMQEVICYPSHASHTALGALGFLGARRFQDKGVLAFHFASVIYVNTR